MPYTPRTGTGDHRPPAAGARHRVLHRLRHGLGGFAFLIAQAFYTDSTTDSGSFASLVVWELYADFAMDSGATPHSSSGYSSPTRQGQGGFASLIVRAFYTDSVMHSGSFASLVVWALYADFAMNSGASPPSLSGCSSPTSPQARGLDTPRCLGTTRRHRVTRSLRMTATSSLTKGLHRADHVHRCRVIHSPRRTATTLPTEGLHLRSRSHTPPPADPLPAQDGYCVDDRRLAPSSRPYTPPPGDPLPAQDGYCLADQRLAPSNQLPTSPPGDPLPAHDGRTSASMSGDFLPVDDACFTATD
uniref:Uncharacterized protein n=1 Tax=Oryza meridionalis TaxID=40149 RepID=A0A0E0DBE7_9ORYZ